MSPTLICESVERTLLTKCQTVSVLSFSLTKWWRLCLARKRAGQMENFTALLSVSIFFFRIINHYTLAPTFVFTKMIFANNLHCYLSNDCLVPANYKWTTSICQLRGFAWMVITSEDFFNKPFKVSLKNEKRERFYYTAPSFGSLQWWTVERECYFPLSFEMPLGRQATSQCAKNRVLRAPIFFFGQKRFNSWPQLDYLLITTKMSKMMKTVILLWLISLVSLTFFTRKGRLSARRDIRHRRKLKAFPRKI